MVSIPRIVTVDPTGVVARIVRSALDLLDLSVIQMDIPTGSDALGEIDQRVNLVVSALALDEHMRGFEFALRVKQASPTTCVILIADENDPAFDEETAAESPFVYLSRPLDIPQFIRVLIAGMESHEKMIEAMRVPMLSVVPVVTSEHDMGPVPKIDSAAAKRILEGLQSELGAMAIILATRMNEALLEIGTTGFIDRDELTQALAPVMQTNIGVKEIIGGQVNTVQFYDGDDFDIFILSVGLHHFICVVFEGQQGSRQFGFVNRFGRKAVEDLIGLIGAEAFFILPPRPKEELPKRQSFAKTVEIEEPVELARAEIAFTDEPQPDPVIEALEPITDFDLDDLFGTKELTLDESLFDLERIEEVVKETDAQNRKGKISWEDAKDLGVLKD